MYWQLTTDGKEMFLDGRLTKNSPISYKIEFNKSSMNIYGLVVGVVVVEIIDFIPDPGMVLELHSRIATVHTRGKDD